MKIFYYIACLTLLFIYCKKSFDGTADGTHNENRQQIRPKIIVGLARVEPCGKLVTLAPQQEGMIAKIYFSAGDHVEKGDTIIALDSRLEHQEYLKALSNYRANTGQVTSARAKYVSARAEAANNEDNFQRFSALYDRNATTFQSLDDARLQRTKSRQLVEETRGNLMTAGHQLTQSRYELLASEAAYGRRFIIAPATGIIFSIDLSPGDIAGPNMAVGTFGRVGLPIAVTEIDELFQSEIIINQHAYLRNRGKNDTITRGVVVFAAPFLREKSLFSDRVSDQVDRRVREVHIELEPCGGLIIGSRVEAVIMVDSSVLSMQ
jgi:multidrug efflux pump subunit AcrA (membrane-fusion protein)